MKKETKRKILKCIGFMLFLSFITINVVYAAKTSSKINFCSYKSARQTMKIIGLFINIIKILVPLILIITGMISFVKPIISGKSEDLMENAKTLIKKVVAGFIIFILPSLVNYFFAEVVGYSNNNFTACVSCVTDPNSCNVNVEDPNIYE